MATDENKVLRLKVYHQVMGIQNLQLNSKDNFSDLRLLLLENTPLTIFENFRFQMSNKILPEFQQIGQVIQSDAKINVILQPFDQKSCLYHLEKIKNIFINPIQWALLNYNRDQQDQIPEICDNSRDDLLQGLHIDNFTDLQLTSPLHLSLSNSTQFDMQKSGNYYCDKLYENKQQEKQGSGKNNLAHFPKFLEILTFSQFNMSLNSINFYRKLSGDFFYLHVRTLQGRDFNITACAEGFYLNNSSTTHFNPSPSNPHLIYYNLLDLFKTISPKFRQTFNKIKCIKFNEIQKSIFSSFRIKPDSQYKNQWIRSHSPLNCNINNKNQHKNSHLYNFNIQNNPINQTSIRSNSLEERDNQKDSLIIKDWNEIIQIHTVNSYDIDAQMINKNKFKFKLFQELQNSVKDGALKLIQGIIPSHYQSNARHCVINTKLGDKYCLSMKNNNRLEQIDRKEKVYRYGSLEFWIADESLFAYRNYENSMPSKRRINTEINNLQILQNLKINGIHFKHQILIKYKGYSIAAQTLVPGYNEKQKYNKLQNTTANKRQKDLILDDISRKLKISPKTLYYSKQGSQMDKQLIKAEIHPDLQLFLANDGRKYLLNLYSLSPRDLNFAGADNNGCFLRRELIQLYDNQVFKSKLSNVSINTMLEGPYNILENDNTKQQKLKLIQLAKFARQTMVPLCLKSFQNQNRKYLGDSKTVIKIMHSFGLSSRYLGMLWKLASQNKYTPHIPIILERVTLIKSLKSIFRKAMRDNKSRQLKNLLAWLFNCIFNSQYMSSSNNYQKMYQSAGTYPYTQKQQNQKDQSQTTHSKKRKKKNQNQKNIDRQLEQNFFCFKVHPKNSSEENQNIDIGIKPEELWKIVKKISYVKFGVQFQQENLCQEKCFRSQFSKSAVLRDLCISLGIVIERNEYFKKQNVIFKPENIIDIKVIIKHAKVENQHFSEMLKQADKLLQAKKIQESIDTYIKTIHFAMLNLGVMTEKFVLAHKKLSEIYFRIGQIDAAMLFAHHGEKLLQKFYGADHIETLEIYSMLSQLYFMKKKFNVAEYYILKMISLALTSFGEEYPQIISGFLNLSTIYQISQKFIDSITCAVKALNLSLKIFGQNNINSAVCYAAMSQIHFQIPDIEKSINFQNKSITILKNILKENDPRLKQAQSTLQFYKNLQLTKKIKECHEKQRKRISNSQLFANFPLFKVPEYTWKQRQNMYRRMQYTFGNPNNRSFI